MEAAHAIRHPQERRPPVPLSTQQMLEVAQQYYTARQPDAAHIVDYCRVGGYPDLAFQLMKNLTHLTTAAELPYHPSTDTPPAMVSEEKPLPSTLAQEEPANTPTVVDYRSLPPGYEQALLQTIREQGPVATGIDGSHWSFQFYSGGVYDEVWCGSGDEDLTHAVLLTGFGPGYWTLKNSFGTGWGEQGYMRLLRNGRNKCGVATRPAYPVVA